MTAQMTEWYPPEIKPVRVGWYQDGYELVPNCVHAFEMLSWWDGKVWRWREGGIRINQHHHWCGLAADPAVTK
jgi:hypothetical protein